MPECRIGIASGSIWAYFSTASSSKCPSTGTGKPKGRPGCAEIHGLSQK